MFCSYGRNRLAVGAEEKSVGGRVPASGGHIPAQECQLASRVTWEAAWQTYLEADPAEVPQCAQNSRHGGGVGGWRSELRRARKMSFLGDSVRKQFSPRRMSSKLPQRSYVSRIIQSQYDNKELVESARLSNRLATQYSG